MNILSVKNISFGYKNNVNVFYNVTFDVQRPCLIGLLGPNGIGKSTLLKCINRIYQVKEGNIYYNRKNINTYSLRKLAQNIAYVPQYTNIPFSIKLMDFVLMGRIPYSSYSFKKIDYEAATRSIEETFLVDYIERDVRKLSGGERQRAFIARALAGDPKVILMDEPTSSLDIKNSLDMLNLIKKIIQNKKIIVIMTIHDLSLAGLFCDRIIVLRDGKIWKDNLTQNVLTEDNIKKIYGVDTHVEYKLGKVYVQLENKTSQA